MLKRKRLAFTAVSLLLMGLLLSAAACGGDSEEATEDTSGGEETTTTEAETSTDGDAEEQAAEPITLGIATALGSIEGADGERVAKLAVEEINAAGGVDVGGESRPFEIVSTDTREHEPGIPTNDALLSVEKLITEQEPDVIAVGAFRSEVLLAEMDLISKYKVPYFVGTAMSPAFETKISENPEKYKYMFRTCLNAQGLVGGLAQVMGFLQEEYGFSKVYFVHQDVLWAAGTVKGLSGVISEQGWEVVGTDAYPTGASDFSSSLNKIKAQGAEVVVPIFDMPQSGILLKQADSMQVQSLFAGFISPAAPGTAWDTFEGGVDGLVNFIFEAGPLPLQSIPKTVEFNDAYAEKYGEEAQAKLSGHGPGPSYDTVYLIKDAIERAGILEPDALVKAIEQTTMDGVIGHIEFDENHQAVYGTDPTKEAVSIAFQWVDGERVPVFPAGVAEGEIQLPEGM